MSITAFSFLTAVFWCNIFISFIVCMRKSTWFMVRFGLLPVLLLFGICLSRLFCSFDYPYGTVVPSTKIFPAIIAFFTDSRISLGSVNISILDCCITLWIAGSLYFMGSYVWHAIRIATCVRPLKTSQSMQINQIMEEIIQQNPTHRLVRVVQNWAVSTPLVVGFLNPTIVLPNMTFTDHQLRMILEHEWNHVLHKDAWVKLFMYFVCAVFWWNPFMHLMKTNLSHALELRCDQVLISKLGPSEQLDYAALLVSFFEGDKQPSKGLPSNYAQALNVSSLLSAKKESQITQRVSLIVNKIGKKPHPVGAFLVCALTVAIFVGSTMFVVQPVYSPSVERGYEPTFSISPENAYLVETEKEVYALYVDGKYQCEIDRRLFGQEPFKLLPIQEKEK